MTDSWRDRAACKGKDPALFVPPRSRQQRHRAALDVCARCPVKAECGEWARSEAETCVIAGGEYIGGSNHKHTHHEPVAVCGTDAGYYRHRRTNNEDACDACKAAHRDAEATRKKRRRLARSAA